MIRPVPPARSPSTRRELRIAVIAPPYIPVPPPGYGGIERVVSGLVGGLARRGHDVTLVAAAGSRAPADLVTPLPAAPILGDPAAAADELCHALAAYRRAGDFDVIHDHTNLGVIIGSVLDGRSAVVHTLHGPWTPSSRRLLSMAGSGVELVAISRAQQAAHPGVRYAGMVHNGVDMDEHPLRVAKDDHLVFVGRTSPEKRPEVAISVARRVGLPLKMIVKHSEPGEVAYWDRVVVPLLGSDIEVFDQPPQAVKVDILGRARALLFPIAWPEPFGLVMTEAMACGTPVIATPLGAAPEVVTEGVTGFLCRTEQEMADAVGKAVGIDPVACRLFTEEHFSVDAMVDGYEGIFCRVTAGPARTRAVSAGG